MANMKFGPKQQLFLLLKIMSNRELGKDAADNSIVNIIGLIEPTFEQYGECDRQELFNVTVSLIQNAYNTEYSWLEKYGYQILTVFSKHDPSIIEKEFEPEIAQLLLNQDNKETINKLETLVRSKESPEKNSRKLQECLARLSFSLIRIGLRPPACQLFLQFQCYPEDQDVDFAKYMTVYLAEIRVGIHFAEAKKTVDFVMKLVEHWLSSEPHLQPKRKALLVTELYQIIIQAETEPSATVSQLLKVVDVAKLQDGLVMLPYSVVLKSAQTLTQWLLDWPYSASYIAPHAISCILYLVKIGKHDDVVKIATHITPKLLPNLMIPALKCVSSVFFCLLMNSSPSVEPVKQLLPLLPGVVNQMNSQRSTEVSNALKILAGYFFLLADKSPELEPEISKAFKDVKCPTESDLRILLCYEMPWFRDTYAKHVTLQNLDPQVQDPVPIHIGPRGLNNLGNTCYMNSILQCLFFTPRFRGQVLMSNPTMQKEYVLFQLQRLFALMKFSNRPSISLNAELIAVVKPPAFTMGHQEDCSEFLVYVLNTLHEQEESLRAPPKSTSQPPKPETKSPCKEETQSPGLGLKRWTTEEDLSDSDPATLLNSRRKARSLATFDETPSSVSSPPAPPAPPLTDAYSDSKDSGIHSVGSADLQEEVEDETQPQTLVQKVFGGKQLTTYKCLSCDFEYRASDKFLDLQLSIPIDYNDQLNVQDLISYLMKPEELIGENQYLCRNCNKLQDATRTLSIEKPPEHLILTLKRFDYLPSTNQATKLMIPIDCPDNITLPTVSSDQEYELYAVVLHTGSTPHSGHYHTQVRSELLWLWLNDEYVTQANDELGKADTPYVLMYRQTNLDDTSIQEPTQDNLLPRLQQVIEEDNALFQRERPRFSAPLSRSYYRSRSPPPPPSGGGCGDNLGAKVNRFVF